MFIAKIVCSNCAEASSVNIIGELGVYDGLQFECKFCNVKNTIQIVAEFKDPEAKRPVTKPFDTDWQSEDK